MCFDLTGGNVTKYKGTQEHQGSKTNHRACFDLETAKTDQTHAPLRSATQKSPEGDGNGGATDNSSQISRYCPKLPTLGKSPFSNLLTCHGCAT